MTSSNRYRHIPLLPLRRLLRDSLKRLYLAIYKLGVRLGVHILPVHYYAPVPNIIELERTVDLWAKPSAMSGVHIDLDEQIDNLRRVCSPFQQEFGQSAVPIRTLAVFGYIEAEVLHAVVRHYKPARLIEIGGGVPRYCTSQAISMNRRDTGARPIARAGGGLRRRVPLVIRYSGEGRSDARTQAHQRADDMG
jgi:hypothetical protein